MLDQERLFHARRARLLKGGYGFFVGNIAGNKNHFRRQFGTVVGDPGMDLRPIDAPRSAHVRDNALKIATRQQSQCFGAGLRRLVQAQAGRIVGNGRDFHSGQ